MMSVFVDKITVIHVPSVQTAGCRKAGNLFVPAQYDNQ